MNSKQRILIIIGLILLGVLIVGFFGLRAFHAFRHLRGSGFGPGHSPPPPIETDVELIRDWMTIPSISKMYHVPPSVLFEAISVPPDGNLKKSLKDINTKYYPQASGVVLKKIKAAVLANKPPALPVPPTNTYPPKP